MANTVPIRDFKEFWRYYQGRYQCKRILCTWKEQNKFFNGMHPSESLKCATPDDIHFLTHGTTIAPDEVITDKGIVKKELID